MADPRKDLSYAAYLRSKEGKVEPSAPEPKKPKDLSYAAYLKQKPPTFLEKAGAVASGVLSAPKQVMMQTIGRLSGIGEDEETKQVYQQAIEAMAPTSKSEKTKQLYETSRAAASLPLEVAKYAAVGAIPVAGVPLAIALGAGEAAGGRKEESSAALAQMLAGKAGMPGVAGALGSVAESQTGRAVFDVALGKALELATRGGVGVYRAAKDLGKSVDEGIAQGLREGVAEAADAATPNLSRRDGYAARTAPEARTERMLPSQTSQTIPSYATPAPRGLPQSYAGPAVPDTRLLSGPRAVPETRPERLLQSTTSGNTEGDVLLPSFGWQTRPIPEYALPPLRDPQVAGPVAPGIQMPAGLQRTEGPTSTLMRLLAPVSQGERQRLFMMPPIPAAVESVAEETVPRAVRRTAEEAAAARRDVPMPPADEAAAEELAAYLSGKPVGSATIRGARVPLRRKSISNAIAAVEEKALKKVNIAEGIGTPEEIRAKLSNAGKLRVAPEALNSVAFAGVGATTGLADEEESSMSPLQRALLYGAAATAGGVGISRYMRKARVAAPSIPELVPMMETINTGKRAAAATTDALLNRRQRAYANLVSETYPLEQVAKRFGTPAQAKDMPGLIAQKQGSSRAAESYLQDNLTPVLKGLSDEEKQSVRSLLKSRRDFQIRQKGGADKSNVPLDVLERGVLAGNADPKVAAAADRITEMHRELLAMRHDAGLLTDEAYNAIQKSDDFYTPLYRELAQSDGPMPTMPGSRTGKFNVFSSGVRKMDRTAAAIESTADPLEMLVVDAARTYRDVAKQRVSNVIFSLADQGKVVNASNLPFIERIKADPINPPKGPEILQQVRDGKLYTYRVTDKDLYNALASQDATSSNLLAKVAGAIKNVTTTGITVLPDFAAANVIRDVAMSGVQRPDFTRAVKEAGYGALAGGTLGVAAGDSESSVAGRFLTGAGLGVGAGLYGRPFLETMSAVKSIVKNDDLYRQFLADGASTQGFYVRNADDAAKILKNLEKDPGFSVDDIIIPKNWLETLRKIGSVGEQATRLSAYGQAKKAGATGAEAALTAQDRTLRFANIGGSKSVKSLAAMTPFWNAKVQGWDKLGRMIKDPKTRALGVGMLTAPSLALWSINKDNPEYWERPIYERNLFWLIPKSAVKGDGEKGFYRIPKPFELGFIFASLPERAFDYMTQAGVDIPLIGKIESASPVVDEPGRAFARSAESIGASTFEGTLPIPEVVGLPAQLAMNKDVFRDRPIVTRPQLSPELQVTPESSAIARALSNAGISPEKTDFFIRNAFGTAGTEASKLVDVAARQVGVSAPDAPTGAAQIPLVGRFVERFTTNTRSQTEPEAFAKERLRELNQVETDYKELQRIGDREKLLDFVEKNMDELELAKRIQPIETELDKLSRLRTQIRKDPSLSSEDRKIALEILREKGQMLSEMLIGVPKDDR